MTETITDLLLHPLRMRILLAISRRQMTPQELAEALENVPQATLYRHLSKMVEGNILKVVEERPNRGTVERVYAINEGNSHISAEELSGASKETLMRLFTSYTVSLLADFAHYLEQDRLDPLKDGMTFTQAPLNLTEEEFEQLMAEVQKPIINALENTPGEGRRQRLFNFVIIPEPLEKQKD